jgi:hypothetical protein
VFEECTFYFGGASSAGHSGDGVGDGHGFIHFKINRKDRKGCARVAKAFAFFAIFLCALCGLLELPAAAAFATFHQLPGFSSNGRS